MWELEPADTTAHIEIDAAQAAGSPIPLLTNNPEKVVEFSEFGTAGEVCMQRD